MVVLGLILLIIGLVASIPILTTIGIILLIVGLIPNFVPIGGTADGSSDRLRDYAAPARTARARGLVRVTSGSCRSGRRRAAWTPTNSAAARRTPRGATASRVCRRDQHVVDVRAAPQVRGDRPGPRRAGDPVPITVHDEHVPTGQVTPAVVGVHPGRQRDDGADPRPVAGQDRRPSAEGVTDQGDGYVVPEPLPQLLERPRHVVDRGPGLGPSPRGVEQPEKTASRPLPARAMRAATGTILSTDSWVGLTRRGSPRAAPPCSTSTTPSGRAGAVVSTRRAWLVTGSSIRGGPNPRIGKGAGEGRVETTMRAIAVTEFGGPEDLQELDLPEPHAGPGEVRVRVHAATVNPTDTDLRVRRYGDGGPRRPVDPRRRPGGRRRRGRSRRRAGASATGSRPWSSRWVRTAAPTPTRSWCPPPRWCGCPTASTSRPGPPADERAHRPAGAGEARPAPGQTLAVTGAAGAFGGYVVQLAKADGLRVIADASEEDEELVRGLAPTSSCRRGDALADHIRARGPARRRRPRRRRRADREGCRRRQGRRRDRAPSAAGPASRTRHHRPPGAGLRARRAHRPARAAQDSRPPASTRFASPRCCPPRRPPRRTASSRPAASAAGSSSTSPDPLAGGHRGVRWACTWATAAAPSPLAEATRFIEPARTSPAAKMPGTVVSSGAGGSPSRHRSWGCRGR